MGLLGLMMISLSARAQEVFVKQQISNINQKSICFAFRSHNHIPDSVASQFQQEIENTIDEFWHVGNKVQYIDYQQAKALRQSKNDNTLVMLVEHKTERHQPHNQRGMRHKQALKHSYFSFALYRPNQYWPLVEVSTKDENPDTLEIVSMINLMQYMLVQEQSGMTQQNWMSTINKSRNQIQGKNLLIDNQFADLSLLEQSGLSWNDVQQTNESEIIDSIRQHRQGATYAISSHVPGNAGQYYRTYIFDCQTANPIFVCSWKSN
jgi:hypothetical protein